MKRLRSRVRDALAFALQFVSVIALIALDADTALGVVDEPVARHAR
jgi:hypothetical protein